MNDRKMKNSMLIDHIINKGTKLCSEIDKVRKK